jgi:pilus assembly protein Flp/PilA
MLCYSHRKKRARDLVEYALILVLVAIVVIAVLLLLGPIIGNVFSTINDSLSSRQLTSNIHYKRDLVTDRVSFVRCPSKIP